MTPERWRRVKEIFEKAAEIDSADRLAFLREECAGDEFLLKEVEELLACHEVPDAPIEKAAEQGMVQLRREMAALAGGSEDGAGLTSDAARTGVPHGFSAGDNKGAFIAGWDRYELVEFIAEGGMGRVYKAVDPVLKRPVALKFLRGDDQRQVERFLQEARAQAQVQHEHICRVYEVGEVQGRHYIAMQYISGQTLAQAARCLTLEQRVTMMKQVAEAVNAAHRLGLIHRDLKPTNIMVERAEDGTWKPYVMDFGLVRDVASPGMTTTGVVMGTPAYMSPEQASGAWSQVDIRSDVYSLGATLYEILTGRPMFEGPPMSILGSVAERDPEPLRSIDATIPLDIETIVMKCVEKGPDRRYQSAKALADELGRFLVGEPILARRSSVWHRLQKKAKRHKALLAVTGAASMILLFLLGTGLYSRWKSDAIAGYAQVYGQRAKEIELTMRTAYMRPRHDIRPERARVLELLRQIESSMSVDGKLAEGPGYAALGKAHLLLHEHDEAYDSLERAWDRGYREAELGYNLGLALGAQYQRALEKAQRAGSSQLREKAVRDAQSRYRDPALAYLKASAGQPGVSTEYVEGLIDLYEGRYESCIAKAAKAHAACPWLTDARKLAGDAYSSRGLHRMNKGDHNGSMADYRQAIGSYRVCQEIFRSDPEVHDAEARTWERVLYAEYNRGKGDNEAFDGALRACDASMQCNPDRAEPYARKSAVLWRWAQYCDDTGRDPRESSERAEEQAKQAIQRDAGSAEAYLDLGMARLILGYYAHEHGRMARSQLESSISSFRKALEREPNEPFLIQRLGNGLRVLGEHQLRIGLDPSSCLSEAALILQRAIEGDPTNRMSHVNLALIRMAQADYEAEQGRDPRRMLSQSLEALSEALRLSPEFPYALAYTGIVYSRMARIALATGEDPTPFLQQADSRLHSASGSAPLLQEMHTEMIGMNACKAECELERNRSPSDSLEAGRRALKRAIEIAPAAYQPHQQAAILETVAGRWAMKSGRSPEPAFRSALDHLQAALRLNPLDGGLDALVATLYRWKAEYDLTKGLHPEKDIREGLAASARSTEAHRRQWEAMAIAGTLELLRARSQPQTVVKAECARQAAEKLGHAIQNSILLRHDYAPLLEQARAMSSAVD
ncbi:MAG: serine/threonine-protein kinase [Acidobacteriota bacterium]